MAGIFLALVAYLVGGVWGASALTVAWRAEGRALNREWAELATIAFLLWPLILAQGIFSAIQNRRERD